MERCAERPRALGISGPYAAPGPMGVASSCSSHTTMADHRNRGPIPRRENQCRPRCHVPSCILLRTVFGRSFRRAATSATVRYSSGCGSDAIRRSNGETSTTSVATTPERRRASVTTAASDTGSDLRRRPRSSTAGPVVGSGSGLIVTLLEQQPAVELYDGDAALVGPLLERGRLDRQHRRGLPDVEEAVGDGFVVRGRGSPLGRTTGFVQGTQLRLRRRSARELWGAVRLGLQVFGQLAGQVPVAHSHWVAPGIRGSEGTKQPVLLDDGPQPRLVGDGRRDGSRLRWRSRRRGLLLRISLKYARVVPEVRSVGRALAGRRRGRPDDGSSRRQITAGPRPPDRDKPSGVRAVALPELDRDPYPAEVRGETSQDTAQSTRALRPRVLLEDSVRRILLQLIEQGARRIRELALRHLDQGTQGAGDRARVEREVVRDLLVVPVGIHEAAGRPAEPSLGRRGPHREVGEPGEPTHLDRGEVPERGHDGVEERAKDRRMVRLERAPESLLRLPVVLRDRREVGHE